MELDARGAIRLRKSDGINIMYGCPGLYSVQLQRVNESILPYWEIFVLRGRDEFLIDEISQAQCVLV